MGYPSLSFYFDDLLGLNSQIDPFYQVVSGEAEKQNGNSCIDDLSAQGKFALDILCKPRIQKQAKKCSACRADAEYRQRHIAV